MRQKDKSGWKGTYHEKGHSEKIFKQGQKGYISQAQVKEGSFSACWQIGRNFSRNFSKKEVCCAQENQASKEHRAEVWPIGGQQAAACNQATSIQAAGRIAAWHVFVYRRCVVAGLLQQQ
ncbi:MAG TPA: hypothetical protein VJW55_01360 [Candidatus Angelobacter sp.]|nr:hypothetical protein [Candidatus Angelobacter sp.]